jgi:hypothetical protein
MGGPAGLPPPRARSHPHSWFATPMAEGVVWLFWPLILFYYYYFFKENIKARRRRRN